MMFKLLMKRFKFLLQLSCTGIASILIASCSSPRHGIVPSQTKQPSVRVLITEKQSRAVVGIQAPALVYLTGSLPMMALESAEIEMTVQQNGTILCTVHGTSKTFSSEIIKIACEDEQNTCIYNGKKYSDTLIFSTDGKTISALNVLKLEKYLQGVVGNEIGTDRKEADFEAIKAQAILARTYALLKLEAPMVHQFDLYDDTRDQVFTGSELIPAMIWRAVYQTNGVVLMFGNHLAETYYHSTCGGATEAPQLVWNRPQGKSFLNGVHDDESGVVNCKISPSYRWREEYTRSEMENIVKKYLPSANPDYEQIQFAPDAYLLDLRITKRMPSGRIAELQILMGNPGGKKIYTVFGDRVRWVLRRTDGSSILRSDLFDLDISRDSNNWITKITIRGGGSGHGVGMCQWGAIGLSRKGRSTKNILQKYFPGTELKKIY